MGGTQSWLNCNSNYAPANSNRPPVDVANSETGGGDPIIAVIMFASTLFGLLLLTALGHCAVLAWRACRHRHRRRYQRKQLHDAADQVANHHSLSAASAAPHPSLHVGGVVGDIPDAEDDGEISSSSSSSTLTSSDTSLDSTTARIAAQVASRRRQSRFLDLTGVRLGGAGSRTPSPTSSWHQADIGGGGGSGGGTGGGGGGGFLRPPPHLGAYSNPAYDNRFDP